MDEAKCFNILTLDGGGSKGFYSLGVLREIEAMLGGRPLCEHFSLIYGTSTGAIIAAGIGLGYSVSEITDYYKKFVPRIMKHYSAKRRSKELEKVLLEIYGDRGFSEFKVDVGIVASNFESLKPTVFKSNIRMAHGSRDTFLPGFGVTIAQAVAASCSAHPFFVPKILETPNQGRMLLIDGGYVANNPAFFALLDALQAFKIPRSLIRLVSIGVGRYPEKATLYYGINSLFHVFSKKLLSSLFEFNSNTLTMIYSLYCADISHIRLDNEVSDPSMKTSLFETDSVILGRMMTQGRETFRQKEACIRQVLSILEKSDAN